MNKKIVPKYVLKKNIKRFLNKVLLTILIVLIGMIAIKNNKELKEQIKKHLYEESIPFQKIKKVYEKNFGNIFSVNKKIKETKPVLNEKLSFKKIETYQKGAKLLVSDHYMVPILESGVVVYIGEKELLGNTIIVEQIDGIDTFYSNISIHNIKLYDYVEKGEWIGEVKDNELFLTFQKNGEYLDYKEYI